jgi:hypothetical protein
MLHIHNTRYPRAMPAALTIKPPPFEISDFDWLGTMFRGCPQVAVAVGDTLVVGSIGEAVEVD